MKILFITRSWPIGGGTEVWLDTLYGALCERGNDVVVAVVAGAKYNRPKEFLKTNRFIKDAYIIDDGSGSPAGRQYRIRKCLKTTRPDIVIPLRVHDALIVSAQEKQNLGFRILYSLHEYKPGFFQDLIDFGACLDHVVVCDALSARVAANVANIDEGKIKVIPQGIHIRKEFNPKRPGAWLELGYVGRLENSQKRVFDLVRICRELELRQIDFRLRIAGTGPDKEKLKAELLNLIDKQIVVMHEWMSQDSLRETFYPEIDALLVTSSWETGPIVAWEAMSDGAILVTSRYRGLEAADFLVDHKNCLIFEVGDIKGAVDRLVEIKKQPDLAMKIQGSARDDVCRARSIDSVAAQWEGLFQDMMAEPMATECKISDLGKSYSSRLESLGIPISVVEWIRKSTGRRFLHQSPGEEWPFHAMPSIRLDKKLAAELEGLDYRFDGKVSA